MLEQSHEFSAKNVEAAIEEGLHQLGVDRDQVDIVVLHEGSRGLLGIGSTNARVRITVRPAPEAEESSPPAPAPAQVTPDRSSTADDAGDHGREEAAPSVSAPVVEDEKDDESTGDGDGEADMDQDAVIALASDLLLKMITLMGLNVQVEGSRRDEEDEHDSAIYLNLLGDDLGSLIGRHGETLSSIQYLVRLMVNQKLHRWTNIIVDVDGYKERRAEKLAQLALRMAD